MIMRLVESGIGKNVSDIFGLGNDKKELLVVTQSEEKERSKIITVFVETKTLLLRARYNFAKLRDRKHWNTT